MFPRLSLLWLQNEDMDGWGITNLQNPRVYKQGNTLEARIVQEEVVNEQEPIYWVAPEPYLGNKVKKTLA